MDGLMFFFSFLFSSFFGGEGRVEGALGGGMGEGGLVEEMCVQKLKYKTLSWKAPDLAKNYNT